MKLFQVLINLLKKFGINANKIELSANDILNLLAGNEINMKSRRITLKSDNFSVDANGNMTCTNATMKSANIVDGSIKLNAKGTNVIQVYSDGDETERIYINEHYIGVQLNGHNEIVSIGNVNGNEGIIELSGNGYTELRSSGIKTPVLNQTSLAEQKKNFEKLENALEIIKNVDIYKYNLKNEKDGTKKHIGFVIGDKYRYSKELTSQENDGVDIYSLASCCLKGIKEQQEQIEQLKNELKEIKEGRN